MSDLVAEMQRFVIAPARLPHLPEDLEPTLAQASQRADVRHPFLTFVLVVGFRPRALVPAEIRPEMYGGPKELVASGAEVNPSLFARLLGYRSRAAVALKRLRILKSVASVAEFRKQSRADLWSGPGQRAEDVVVGMDDEERLNRIAIVLQLRFKQA